jgi:hypothetical protein
MNANEVLIDLLADNQRRLHRALAGLPDEALYWKPDRESNNMAVTLWHMGRILDVFLIRQTQGKPPESECWFREGWAAQSGYDPRGLGQNGWGMLTGYTLAEVDAIPHLKREQLLGYLDQVYATVTTYLEDIPLKGLLEPATGFEGRYSRYQCIQMALLDNVRHLGEIFALKTRWERQEG